MSKQTEKLQDGINTAASFMDFLRANVGFNDEWPIEIMCAEDIIPEFRYKLNEFEEKVYSLRTNERKT